MRMPEIFKGWEAIEKPAQSWITTKSSLAIKTLGRWPSELQELTVSRERMAAMALWIHGIANNLAHKDEPD